MAVCSDYGYYDSDGYDELQDEFLVDNFRTKEALFIPQISSPVDDDGWDSDPEPPVCLSKDTPDPNDGRKPYMRHDNHVWVDEAQGCYSTHKSSDPGKVTELLREMFAANKDVYSLLLVFVEEIGSGKTRNPLLRMALTEFQDWLKEQKEKPVNAVITASHRKAALESLIVVQPVVVDLLIEVFELQATSKPDLLDLIDTLIMDDRLKEAVSFTWKFKLQDHFEMKSMMLPLIARDKINLIENYIEGSVKLQEDFVRMLDDLCEPGTTQEKIDEFVSSCGLGPKSFSRDLLSQANCKLNFQQLYRLALRIASMYNLNITKFPNIHTRKANGVIHHLLTLRYVEGSITKENMDDLLLSAVGSNSSLQQQLVKELLRFNDHQSATSWAIKFNLPKNLLPFSVQLSMEEYGGSNSVQAKEAPRKVDKSDFCKLPLPLSNVFFINNAPKLGHCWTVINKVGTVVGIDAEWKLPSCNGGILRLALLQLAVDDAVFLLDMVTLPLVVDRGTLRGFMSTLFQSNNSLKLGYGIQADLAMLSRTLHIGDILCSPVQVLDLRKMEELVYKEKSVDDGATIQHLKKPILKAPLLSTPTGPQTSRPNQTTSPVRDGWVQSEEGSKSKGLARLVLKCFGKPLDKTQQMSDWEKRPLTTAQISYAALDAHCLLGVYKHLASVALAHDISFKQAFL